MAESHVLIVTGTESDREYAIECPGVTALCRMWVECETCYPRQRPEGFDYEAWDEGMHNADGMVHGAEHNYIDGLWMTPTDRCFVSWAEGMVESAADLGLGPGRHPVDYEFDEGFVYLAPLAAALPEERTDG